MVIDDAMDLRGEQLDTLLELYRKQIEAAIEISIEESCDCVVWDDIEANKVMLCKEIIRAVNDYDEVPWDELFDKIVENRRYK